MHFSSTLNPLSKSNGDVPIAIVSYSGRRKFVLTAETYKEMIELVRGYFDIAQSSAFIKLETSTLDVCKGRSIEVDSSAWVHMWRVLDEINVVVAPSIGAVDESEQTDQEANPQVTPHTPVPSALATPPPVSDDALPSNQEQHSPLVVRGNIVDTPPPIPADDLPPLKQEEHEHDPSPSVASGSSTIVGPAKKADAVVNFPLAALRDEGDHDESMADELEEDNATDCQSNDAPSWFVLSSPPAGADGVKPKVKLEKRLKVKMAAGGSGGSGRKKGHGQAARSPQHNDVFSSTTSTKVTATTMTSLSHTEIVTSAVPAPPKERFHISITGPDGRSVDFKLKKGHTVQKVLLTACNYFAVDFNRAYLYLENDATGDGKGGYEYALDNSDTVTQAGLKSGSDLVLHVVDEPEEEFGEEVD